MIFFDLFTSKMVVSFQ